MANSKEMTRGAVFPLLFSFTMPLLLGNLLQQTYSLIDAAIVGKFLGINSLAAVGASTSVIFLILGFCNGCCAGFGIPVAQKFGARDYATMRRYVAVGLQLATVMSVVIAAISGFYCRDILRGMQTPGNIFDGAYEYLFVTFIGIPCTFFYNLLASIMRALGDSKTPFWFLLFSTVLNVFLDLFCILGLGWGVMGAAIATVFSQGLSAILCYLYMLRKFPILRATSSEDRRFHAGLARTLLAMGVPMGLQFSITAIGSIMLQSANNGAGKPERILQGIKVSSLMMLTYAAATWMILMLGSRWLALLFVAPSEVEILDYTEQFLHISCWFFPAVGLLCILRYAIQGVGFSNLAMLSGVSEMIARVLVSLYAVPAFGFLGVCFGDPLAWVAADLFLIPAFLYVYKKIKKRLDDEKVSVSAV